MRVMEDAPLGPDAVRAHLDGAVAEAAERWVGRAADATAYADLVAAVLARREALCPLAHLPEHFLDQPLPVRPGLPSRHHERRARPRWPLQGEPPPFPVQLDVRGASHLPSRPPGRHRLPPPDSELPRAIDLRQNLHTVLDWLGRPER